MCTDGVYGKAWARRFDVRVLLPHRKPRGKELTSAQVAENDIITEFRGDIERVIFEFSIVDTLRNLVMLAAFFRG